MGRKRKHVHLIAEAVQGSTVAKEEQNLNVCPETTTEEKLDMHSSNQNAADVMNVENKVQANSNDLSPKMRNVFLRRSARLRNSTLPIEVPVVNPSVERANLVQNEKEEIANSQQVITLPVISKKNLEQEPQVEQVNIVPNANERNMEEKVDYLVQALDEFRAKVFERPKEDSSYKSLYIDAQKKIEALMEENYELVKKLEFALGKVEAYEKMKDAVGASKEVILVSNLAKARDVTEGLLPQTVHKRIPSAAVAADKSKRKKKN